MPALTGRNVLIIGGSRFTGRVLVSRLKEEGCDIWLLNRGSQKIAGVHQIIADRKDITQLRTSLSLLPDFIDTVIDTCSYDSASSESAWTVLSSRVNQWIHLSSAAVYRNTKSPQREKDQTGGADVWGDYGRNKSAADSFLIKQGGNKPVVILRPPYIYGPKNYIDRETFIWSRLLQSRPVLVPGDGNAQAQFIHVADLVNAFIMTLKICTTNGAYIYNVGPDETISLRDYVTKLAQVAKTPDTGVILGQAAQGIDTESYFPFGDYSCFVDSTLIRQELGWKPTFSLIEGHKTALEAENINDLKTRALNTETEDKILARANLLAPKLGKL
ncbi:MAG: NAD-dependent epimerase/dehydratase family protein [Alphaproteobacteria bacterium]|nr:NAD-dependent epimerase/dehydratase family protein [Alphaproteobacteria bacterium]